MEKNKILELIDKTIKIRERAYAEYSNFKVGALIISDKDKEYSGVNVENQSYGLSMCAERNAIFSGITNGMKKIKLIVVVGDTKEPITPCGACRQVMSEFSDKDTKVIMSNLKKEYKIVSMKDLLPFAFKL
ncbi:MAG: cytidine deaminase [Fusobacteriota bacterium]